MFSTLEMYNQFLIIVDISKIIPTLVGNEYKKSIKVFLIY